MIVEVHVRTMLGGKSTHVVEFPSRLNVNEIIIFDDLACEVRESTIFAKNKNGKIDQKVHVQEMWKVKN